MLQAAGVPARLRALRRTLTSPEWIAARNEQREREGERVIAHYRERDRERQERELKEGKEAIAKSRSAIGVTGGHADLGDARETLAPVSAPGERRHPSAERVGRF
jgi:hypothetical protein